MIFHYFFKKMPKLFAVCQITPLGKKDFQIKNMFLKKNDFPLFFKKC